MITGNRRTTAGIARGLLPARPKRHAGPAVALAYRTTVRSEEKDAFPDEPRLTAC